MQEWTKSPRDTITVGIVLFDRFSNLCLANCIEPMRAANTLSGRVCYRWRFFTLDGGPVASSSGLPVLPQASLAGIGAVDFLHVVASYDHLAHDTPSARSALRRAARTARVVVGLDAGPWLLASAGLLDGRRATVHWEMLDSFAETFHRVEAEQTRWLRDGNRITCAGAMSALEMTLDLIAGDLGEAMRIDIDELFLRADPPLGTVEEPGARDPLVRRALALMRGTLERPMDRVALSRALSCPPKTLDRRFRSALGAPPGIVYRHLRLSAARQMVEGTRLPVAEIALRCGYDNPAAMTRAFRARFGTPPAALRSAG